MKRSEINDLVSNASACFTLNGWRLPRKPKWDVTDFGLGDWRKYGLVLINLCSEPEYCEKLMYARKGMVTPCHMHKRKKEDIICRTGMLGIRVWKDSPDSTETFGVKYDGEVVQVRSGDLIELHAGTRLTVEPGVYHEFFALSEECIMGEVSTANDDLHDNFFVDPNVGRFPEIEEDEPPVVHLLSDQ